MDWSRAGNVKLKGTEQWTYLCFSGTGSTADINTGAYTKSHTQVGTHLLPPVHRVEGVGVWNILKKNLLCLFFSPFFPQMFSEKQNHFQANFLWWCFIMSWADYPAKSMDCCQQGQHDGVGLTLSKNDFISAITWSYSSQATLASITSRWASAQFLRLPCF